MAQRLSIVLTLLLLILAGLGTALASPMERSEPKPSQLTAHRLWTGHISPNADSQPALASSAGPQHHGILLILAGNNTSNCNPGNAVRRATLYAFDASNGHTLWTRSTSGPSRCTTAGPVVDNRGWVYATGLDGKIHRYQISNGQEDRHAPWPVTYTLSPDVEKAAAMPRISNGYLYVTTSGFIGDQGHYQGHLVTVNLSKGTVHVFNSLCSDIPHLLTPSQGSNYCQFEQSGLFGRGQAVTDPINHDVYIVSGNGPWNGRTNWGDTVMKLDPSGSRLVDAFTPTNQQALDSGDADLGSTGPAILPPIESGGHIYHLLVQGGKGPACDSCSGAALRLLNRDNLSGHHSLGQLGGDLADRQAPGGCQVLTTPAVWRGPSGSAWVFYANDCGVGAYEVSAGAGGKFQISTKWTLGQGGTSPVLAKGVLYIARSGMITAYRPQDHAVLWQNADIGQLHWEYPLVSHGRLFITDEDGRVFAYRVQ